MVERKCPTCNQVTITEVGLHGDNFKKLFQWPTFKDWIILFMLLMAMLLSYAYNAETKTCRDTMQNLDEICEKRDNPFIFGASEEIDMNEFNASLAGLNISYDDETKAGNQTMPEV